MSEIDPTRITFDDDEVVAVIDATVHLDLLSCHDVYCAASTAIGLLLMGATG